MSKMGIWGKIFLLILAIGIFSTGISVYWGFNQAKDALEKEALAHLVSIRDIKRQAIEDYFQTVSNLIITFSEQEMIVDDAMSLLKEHFNEFTAENNISDEQLKEFRKKLYTYYTVDFATEYKDKNQGELPDIDLIFNQLDRESVALQYYYIANNKHPLGLKHELDHGGIKDNSHYSEIHEEVHPLIRSYHKKFGFYDIFLVDSDTGKIAYSVHKKLDFSTSLIDGPYANTNLGKAFRMANEASDKDAVVLLDFENYTPSYEAPASFIASPIFDGKNKIGVAIFQLSLDRISKIMQERSGLGKTGETFLIGPDLLLRSYSRFFEKSTILKQKIDREAPRRAIAGKKGTMWVLDYRDIPVLNAYTPVNILNLNWGLIAKMDEAEVLAPILQLRQQVLVGALVLIGIILFLSFIISRAITSPLRDLDRKLLEMAATKRYGDQMPLKSRDEVGSLINSFNKMSSTIESQTNDLQTELIKRAKAEEELRKSHDELENRVNERTEELSIMNANLSNEIIERKQAEKEIINYSKKMETALYRAEDVLNIISKPPSLVPFFVTSPVYRIVRTIGGGDTIRWLDFKSEYAGIYLHDVSGHDIQEILLNILATSIADDHKANPKIKSISMPSLFLNDMNERLCKFCDGTPQYITALYLLLNFNMREIHLSLAGHPKPWLINSDGTAEQIGKHGFILGQFEIDPASGDAYEDITVRLKNGQMLFLYSDGLMEQTNGQGMPFERKFREKIVTRLKSQEPESAYEILKAEFEAHLDGKQPNDDVSFIFIGSRPEDMYESFEFVPNQQLINSLKNHKSAVGKPQTNAVLDTNLKSNDKANKPSVGSISNISQSYESITDKLLENGWSKEKIGHVRIALDEIIINAILHGNLLSGSYIVNIRYILHRDILEVSVTDEGVGFGSFNIAQKFTEEDLLKESGRGLFMVSQYAAKMYFNETGNKCWTIFTKS